MIPSTDIAGALNRVLDKFPGARQTGNDRYMAKCPAHDDKHASLSIGIGEKGVVVKCQAGCGTKDVLSRAGLTFADLFPPRENHNSHRPGRMNGQRKAKPGAGGKVYPTPEDAINAAGRSVENGKFSQAWRYFSPARNEVMRVARFDIHDGGKQFRPIHKNCTGWKIGDPPGQLPLYRWPELPASGPIIVCEGEKAADAAAAIGLASTTSAHGSQSAHKTDWTPLAGVEVWILPDADTAGEKYAIAVAEILLSLEPPAKVKIIRLPGLPEHGDIVEFVEHRDSHTGEEIVNEIEALAAAAPDFTISAPLAAEAQHPEQTPPDCPLTDAGNGERLFCRYRDQLRFVVKFNKAIVFTGKRWEIDETGAATRLALETMRDVKRQGYELTDRADRASKDKGLAMMKHAVQSEAAKRLRDMLDLASKVEGATIAPDRLDSDPWLLNVGNGTLDLRTGDLRPHSAADFITRMIPVDYDPSSTCPIFLAFLDRIFKGNGRLIGFVQRIIGYTLTGITSERCLFILFGTGANGKSTLLGVLRELLADYAMPIRAEVIMVKHHGDGIPNDIARLKGARFVPCSETDDGKRIAEALIKQLTGGEDVITARFMRAEWFDFRPEFKLFMATNHRPEIRGTDPAIWDRIRLIPFDVRIPEDEQDADLPAKLKAELPGILAWAVQGCLEWQADGLGAPDEVKQAIEDYRADMDVLGEFLAECCVIAPGLQASASELYDAYKKWCQGNGEEPVNQTKFGRKLNERGIGTARDVFGRKVRVGIGVQNANCSEKPRSEQC